MSLTPAVALHPYLRDCADDLVDAAGRGDVHDLRVACRRIRSVLRSCRSLWTEPEERLTSLVERCRQLGSQLSDARDDEVAADVLRELADNGGWLDGDLEQLLGALGLPATGHTEVDGGGAVAPELLAEALTLAGDVRAFAGETADLHDESTAGGVDQLGRRVESERARVLRRARLADTPEAWHDVRKASKRLRYTAEAHLRSAVDQSAADPSSTTAAASAKATVTAAKRLQTVLGELRDVEQLVDRLVACTPGLSTDRALAAGVRRARELEHRVAPTVDDLHRPRAGGA